MSNQEPRIAVISGGESTEAAVSRSSAASVIDALQVNYTQVENIELDAQVAASLASFAPDLVFPILHGYPGEDGTVQGFLEILHYNYVGSGVHASACALDKIVAKHIFRDADLPLAEQCVLTRDQMTIEEAIAEVHRVLPDRQVVLKPARQGSALGISMVHEPSQLRAGIELGFQFDDRVLVEEKLKGKEITVGVIDTPPAVGDYDVGEHGVGEHGVEGCGLEAFPVIEIITPANTWYDYQHRYTKGLSKHLMPADLPDSQTQHLQRIAIEAHQALGCRDLSRADFIVTDTDIYLLEVNTMPGMTPTSLYPEGAQGYGMGFPDLMRHFVTLSLRRPTRRSNRRSNR